MSIEGVSRTAATAVPYPVAPSALDALRARYAGPYQVDGQRVTAPPMFRMNGGFNIASAKQREPTLRALCAKAGLGHVVGLCLAGRATPAQLTRVTQLLIDRGHLPKDGGDVASRIRQMQWQFGLGLDCVGFTFQAVQDVHGVAGKHALPNADRVGSLPRLLQQHFVKTAPELARPGDVINLVAKKAGEPGHNVIVRSNQPLDPARQAALGKRGEAVRAGLAQQGPIQVIDVDSSWGAGPTGADYGGVRGDTWMYNTRTKEWADFDPESGRFRVSATGPQDERATGAYRPRGAK